jgi:hypothetical protein
MSLPLANVGPTAHDAAVNALEDTPLDIVLTATDQDTPAISLIYTVLTQPTHGALSGTAPNLTYTPDLDYIGPDSFTFMASDEEFDSNIATISITVGDVDDPPTAQDQAVNTDEGVPVDVTLVATDEDTAPQDLVYTVVSDPSHGSLSGVIPNLTYTPNPEYSGPDSFTWKVNDGASDSNIATASISINAGNLLYFTIRDAGTVGANGEVSAQSVDIIAFDGTTMSIYFDGSNVGLPSNYRIDGLDVLNGSEILMSFAQDQAIPGIAGTVEDTDIVKFTATALGENNTAGSFELYFNGRDVGLASNDDDVDGIELLPDGRLLVSTLSNFTALGTEGGLTGTGHDIIALTVDTLGANTSGNWAMYFDGTDVELTTNSEAVAGFSVDASGKIYLSTVANYSVTGVSGGREDVFAFNPTTLGDITSGTYDSAPFLDGSFYQMVGDSIFALDVP